MKISALFFAAAPLLTVAAADASPKVHAGAVDVPVATVKAAGGKAANETTPVPTGSSVSTPLSELPQKKYGNAYHMPYVRVVQARVQGDKPLFVKGRFVSEYGKGDLALGYRASLDTVNTASVEGALLYVQAEGINQNSRSEQQRCIRKNNMTYVVLYEILIAQTNETIAQFQPGDSQEGWTVPEYGPMTAMDEGRCTPDTGEDGFPPECLQFNGDKDQPDVGPFVGAGGKNNDVRAPYPNAVWFSFPNTCPLKRWGEKNDANNACRATTRKGLCDLGKAPDGVECTFAYDILGWVPIDDVVGITSFQDDSGKNYSNFKAWCEASKDHIEFAGDVRNGKMDKGLDFWQDPLNTTRNSERANEVVYRYQDIVNGAFKSSQIPAEDLQHFKALPSPQELAEKNPPCYKTVRTCNTGFGCKRSLFSQICMSCKTASPECKTDPSFKFPELVKAPTKLPEKELSSGSKLGGKNGATGRLGAAAADTTATTSAPTDPSAAASATAHATVALVLATAIALAV